MCVCKPIPHFMFMQCLYMSISACVIIPLDIHLPPYYVSIYMYIWCIMMDHMDDLGVSHDFRWFSHMLHGAGTFTNRPLKKDQVL